MASYLTETTVCFYYQEHSLNSVYENYTENANTLFKQNIIFGGQTLLSFSEQRVHLGISL